MGPSICVNVGRGTLGILSGINRKRIRVSSPSYVRHRTPSARDILFRCSGDAVSRQRLRKSRDWQSTRINGRPLITAQSQNATGMLINVQPHGEKAFQSHFAARQHTCVWYKSGTAEGWLRWCSCPESTVLSCQDLLDMLNSPGWHPRPNTWPGIRFLRVMGRKPSQCWCLTVAGTRSVNALLRQRSSRVRMCTCSLFDKNVWSPK